MAMGQSGVEEGSVGSARTMCYATCLRDAAAVGVAARSTRAHSWLCSWTKVHALIAVSEASEYSVESAVDELAQLM